MKSNRASAEFEGAVDEHGRITVPRSVLEQFGTDPPRSVFVRLTGKSLGVELRRRGVHEEEIERIAALQRESRDQVVKFLLSEGLLKRHTLLGNYLRRPSKGRKR